MGITTPSKPKSFLSRFFITIGLVLFFSAIILVYTYAGLMMIYNWTEYNPGPGGWLDQDKIFSFFVNIGYDEYFRMIFILTIIGVFLLSLFSMLIHNKFVKKKDTTDSTKIVVIHDDIIHVNPDKDETGNEVYHPESFIGKNGYYTMDELYTRKGTWRIILKIANYLTIAAILGIVWTFYRASAIAFEAIYDPAYLATDEAYILITSCVTYLLIYYLIRCPDFVKSLAATGFKRIYVRKAHLHETFIGLLLTIGGILFALHGAGEGALGFLERATGLFFLILGVYMIGRDWKDFVMGKFLRD